MTQREELELKILNNEELDEEDLEYIAYSGHTQEMIRQRRWSISMITYYDIEVDGVTRTFALEWERAATENQEDFFGDQPYEVFPKEVTVTKYFKKDS